MEIKVTDSNEIKVLEFNGMLDTVTSNEAESTIAEIINSGSIKLLMDFKELDYISSAGLRILLGTAKQLMGLGGEMRICHMNDTVKEVFDISGFSTIFKTFENFDDAIKGF